MNWLEQENRIKLHILTSLARSQRALATMMENMAEVSGTVTAGEKLAEQIEAISRYQREIAVKMLGIKIRKKVHGRPGKPWLRPNPNHPSPTASAKK